MGQFKGKETIKFLESLADEEVDEIVMDDLSVSLLSQAIRAIKTVERLNIEIKGLYRDFSNQHDAYSDGLRKGLQCIEAVIEENI